MPTVNKVILDLGKLLRDAEAAATNEAERRAALSAISQQVDAMNREIKAMIVAGGTTGNHLLDVNIVTRGVVRKDKGYQFLVKLQKRLDEHPGGLLVKTDFYQQYLALLTNKPKIFWQKDLMNSVFGRESYNACIPTVTSYRRGALTTEPELTISHEVEEYVRNSRYNIKSDDRYIIAIGQQEVQQWFESQPVRMAIITWRISNIFGHPLRIFPDLALEIRDQREDMVAKLVEALQKLKDIQELLAHWQRFPAEALKVQGYPRDAQFERRPSKVIINPTDSGVNIDFGYGVTIQRAKNKLIDLLNSAVDLEMEDNKTFQQAKAACGYVSALEKSTD